MCNGFCSSLFLFILRFIFVELFKQKQKTKKKQKEKQTNKQNVGRYIRTSLCKYQDQQDHLPIIHDKLEDRFTTVTQRFQDFSHKDICTYITS